MRHEQHRDDIATYRPRSVLAALSYEVIATNTWCSRRNEVAVRTSGSLRLPICRPQLRLGQTALLPHRSTSSAGAGRTTACSAKAVTAPPAAISSWRRRRAQPSEEELTAVRARTTAPRPPDLRSVPQPGKQPHGLPTRLVHGREPERLFHARAERTAAVIGGGRTASQPNMQYTNVWKATHATSS